MALADPCRKMFRRDELVGCFVIEISLTHLLHNHGGHEYGWFGHFAKHGLQIFAIVMTWFHLGGGGTRVGNTGSF